MYHVRQAYNGSQRKFPFTISCFTGWKWVDSFTRRLHFPTKERSVPTGYESGWKWLRNENSDSNWELMPTNLTLRWSLYFDSHPGSSEPTIIDVGSIHGVPSNEVRDPSIEWLWCAYKMVPNREDTNIPLVFPHIGHRPRRLATYMITNLSRGTYHHSWRPCCLVTRL
jgi:hypothetical protein